MKEIFRTPDSPAIINKTTRSDADIYDQALSYLEEDERLDSDSIQLEFKDGNLNLSGVVDSFLEKQVAEELVAEIEGVLAVTNNIQVEMPSVDDMDTQTADDKRVN